MPTRKFKEQVAARKQETGELHAHLAGCPECQRASPIAAETSNECPTGRAIADRWRALRLLVNAQRDPPGRGGFKAGHGALRG